MRRAMAAVAMAGMVVSQMGAPTAAMPQQTQTATSTVTPDGSKDQRMIVLFFDLSSMLPDDVTLAVASAKDYIDKQMAPSDEVAVVSLVAGLSMEQDFTSDKPALLKAVSRFDAPGDDGGPGDNGSSFTANGSVADVPVADRQLYAIRTICKSVEKVEQKKSLLYFSGSMPRQIEDKDLMRAATDECMKANTAMYAVDTRGLKALNPVSR